MGDLAMAGDQHDGARNLAIVDIVADPLRDPGEPVEGEPHALRGDHRKVLSDRPERPRGDDTERHEEAAQQMPIPAPTGARHWRPRLSTCDNISQTDPQKLARDPKAAAGGGLQFYFNSIMSAPSRSYRVATERCRRRVLAKRLLVLL